MDSFRSRAEFLLSLIRQHLNGWERWILAVTVPCGGFAFQMGFVMLLLIFETITEALILDHPLVEWGIWLASLLGIFATALLVSLVLPGARVYSMARKVLAGAFGTVVGFGLGRLLAELGLQSDSDDPYHDVRSSAELVLFFGSMAVGTFLALGEPRQPHSRTA